MRANSVNMTTIAAIATPAGRGGLGVIRLSGPDAHIISLRLCGRQQSWTPRHAHFSRFFDADNSAIDAGLVLYFKTPHSYTGEDVVELQAHGSPVLLEALLQRVLALGATLAAPGVGKTVGTGVACGRAKTLDLTTGNCIIPPSILK